MLGDGNLFHGCVYGGLLSQLRRIKQWRRGNPGVEPHEVMFSVKNFERDEQSRTHLEVNENGAIFTWAENDTLGIFPSQGDQVTFAMQTGAGTANAVFSGGSWELKKVLLIMRTTLSAENILTDRTRKIKYG